MKLPSRNAGPGLAARAVRRAALVLILGSVAPPCFADALSFDDAVALATRDTAQWRASQSRLEAARQSAIPAGELPDPRVGLGVENYPVAGPDRYSLVREPMTMQRIVLMQEVPNRAKREARIGAAAAQVARSEVEQRLMAVTLQREAASSWIRRFTVERQLARLAPLFEENLRFEHAIQAQWVSGRSATTDIVLPRQEAAMLAERREELLAQHSQATAALRRWIGSAADAPLQGEPHDWALHQDALAADLHRHPELQSLDAAARVLDAEVHEAEASKRPDWSVELAYQRRGPTFGDMVSVQFRFDLPIFSGQRQDPRIAAKRAERDTLDAERAALLEQHEQELSSDWADLERLDKALERNRSVLQPLAHEKIELAMAAYSSGKATLSEVIAARREWFELQLKEAAIAGERALIAMRLHYAVADPMSPGAAQ